MFIALNESGERVEIRDAVKNNKYFCPVCGEPLTIRAADSLAVKMHFAHKRGTQCDDWKHDMSEWHYNWQQCFPKECREVVVENNGEKHRADILIGNTVIEFQHSPITGEEINKRNQFYTSCGHSVFWVFDATNKIKNINKDGPIDPMQCNKSDLCWKRARREFINQMPEEVMIFLQYGLTVSNEQYRNRTFDLMLPIKKMSPKSFTFWLPNSDYILPENFLKEFGIGSADTLSISDMISDMINKLQAQQNQYNQKRNQNTLLNISKNITITRNRGFYIINRRHRF